MNVKILGTGCPKCQRLEALVHEVAAAEGLHPEVEKVTEIPAIMAWGVMQTPGLIVDGVLKLSGRTATRTEIATWLKEAAARA